MKFRNFITLNANASDNANIAVVVLLTGFEILVAVLQAYVFTILTCLYLKGALELH